MSSLRESLSAIAMWSDPIVRYHATARQKLARDGEPSENDFARAHDPATLGDCDQSSWVFILWQLQRCVDRFFLAWESANDQLDGLADLAIPDFAHWKHGLRKLLIKLPRWLDRDVRWTITRDCPPSWHSQVSELLDLQDDLLATGDSRHQAGMMFTVVPRNTTEETATTPAVATDLAVNRRIPAEHRTKPMSFRTAAKWLGKGNGKDAAEWVSKCVKDGILPCESHSRQNHIFDRRSFPKSAWHHI